MAQQSKSSGNSNTKKKGPGRPPGSKNKPKNTGADQSGPTREEVIAEMHRRNDRDKRNMDVIWSITLFAISLFLFFTVVMDTTGSFGTAVHNIFNGLFGLMALILPFLVFIFACLLVAGKLQHIGIRTTLFSILIYINICVLNSYRFIDVNDLRYGFHDIADFYVAGVDGRLGGVFGMEIGSILAKFFGMPGLLIIATTIIIISVFLVANTPISRFFVKMNKKRTEHKFIKELEREERARIAAENFAQSMRSEDTGIRRPLIDNNPEKTDIEYTQILPPPDEKARKSTERSNPLGRFMDYIAGIDSETGEPVAAEEPRKESSASAEKAVKKEIKKTPAKPLPPSDRDFEKEEEDYAYPGKRKYHKTEVKAGYGLGNYDDNSGSSGSYGLGSSSAAAGRGLSGEASEPAAKTTSRSRSAAAKPASKPAEKKASSEASAKNSAPSSAKDTLTDADAEKLAAGFSAGADDAGYELPPVSLLKKDNNSKQLASDAQLEARGDLLEQTLNDFGVDARVIKVTQGASVTRYEVQPATGVKVASITRLADDIALNLRAKSIRIEAPIPGKAAVGIEVENDKPTPVLIRDIIDSPEFMEASSKIEFVVGKDISGNNIVADLRDMPHMLIAGATGSGKSVCINSIITSFLYKAKPSELKLIMVDPKVVELGNYNGIPHLLTPVVTDPRKAARALAVAVEEMDKRYELFAENNVKELSSYNELMRANHRYADCKPQIVIIIDELADLMMASPSEVESSIIRLAQKARAAGMHLIVATQRPSVDVVTGLIKANIPSRIAFSVASQIDSRTILDMAGAEKLLGKGDMLFSPVGSTKPYRVQGPYISEKEIDKVIKFVKKQGGDASYDDEIQKALESEGRKGGSEPQDELTEDAIAFIFKSKQASVSMLQRRFRIGYNRAARIIDEIEEKGIIGPSDGSRPRQLLITEDEYYGNFTEDEAGTESPDTPERRQDEVQAAEPAAEASVNTAGSADAGGSRLSNTRAMDSFNSLPESVKRMVMDADSEDKY